MPTEDLQPQSSALEPWQIAEEWWNQRIPGSPAVPTVEAWNFLNKAKEELFQRLGKKEQ